jgi:hypothetical protein
MAANGNGDGRNHGKVLLNGSSLSSLVGAVPSAKLQVEVRFPVSSMHEVLEAIDRLGHTGGLTINYSHGKARDLKWAFSRETDPPDV